MIFQVSSDYLMSEIKRKNKDRLKTEFRADNNL